MVLIPKLVPDCGTERSVPMIRHDRLQNETVAFDFSDRKPVGVSISSIDSVDDAGSGIYQSDASLSSDVVSLTIDGGNVGDIVRLTVVVTDAQAETLRGIIDVLVV